MIACKAFCFTPNGAVVAAFSDGSVQEQVQRSGNRSGTFDTEWKPLPMDGLTGRVVQLATRYDQRLVAMTAAGELLTLEKVNHKWADAWKTIASPADAED